ETRNRLIAEDPKSEALLKPMVRGRDVQKYAIELADMWLINAHNNPPVEIDEYPAIKEYLDQFYPQIEKRYDQGKTPYNLRNCAYLKDFDKPKIVWGEISDAPKFAYDESGIYVEATSFIMTGESLKYLLAVLNSNLSKWYFEHISTTTGMGTNRWKKFKLELLPIAECEDEQPFTDLVDQIIEHKKQNQDTAGLEAQIDRMVYDLYGLTEEEIAVVEGRRTQSIENEIGYNIPMKE
ncbi:MAG TPA: class I SAM-dependent DNA methyltransferase, partial [Epsilonproteobacteria bacterium]|nr:class I SAM-dependent DNA methyltransferase [Campylobacterota bacterium]